MFIERITPLPVDMLVALLIGCGTAWLLSIGRRKWAISTVLLWCVAGLLASVWHRVSLAWPAQSIGHFATQDRMLVHLRGAVAEDVTVSQPRQLELRSPQADSPRSAFLLQASQLQVGLQWQAVTGLVRVTVEGELSQLRNGDGIELIGSLVALSPPVNPGGQDFRQAWLDQGIQATLYLKSVDAITPHLETSHWSVPMMMARVRAWVRETLFAWLPPQQAGVAQALICGEQAALSPDQFEGYLQTGVYHVLAVSGQHLVILCAFIGFCLRFSGGSMRSRAVWLVLFVLAYTLLTGARPPVVRAAVMVGAWCGSLWLLRTTHSLNNLALAWIIVAILQPADLANTGCQLSFLAVLILMQMIGPWYRWFRTQLSPLDRLEERIRPNSLRMVYWVGVQLKWAYLTALLVWLGTAPLIADRFHLVSPVAVVLGPVLALLITVALICGFLLIVLAGVPVFAHLLTWVLGKSLLLSDGLVQLGRTVPFGYGFWPDIPDWWVICFYFGLVLVLITPQWWRWWKPLALAALAWLALGLWLSQPQIPKGLRVTVLAVGHGTAVVIETNDGRCLVYDAGSLAGPEIVQRHISSYLWSRGRTKIDEVILSHADLDHFNGLPELADRFRIGLVRMTPTFAENPNRGTRATLRHLERSGLKTQLIFQGEQLRFGDLMIEALHPPRQGPPGPENVRSLVLLLTFDDQTLLLTGDLEHEGLEMVIRQPIKPIDILVAPHHGSSVSNTERFAAWCQPTLVISSETFPRGPKPDPYTPIGATFWRTWIHGGVTVEINNFGTIAKTHLTKQQWAQAR